jgi:hypothetical protein
MFAAASLMVSVASLGTLGVIPFVMLKSLGRATLAGIACHLAGVVTLSLVAAVLAAGLIDTLSAFTFTAVLCAVLVLQGFWTYVLRARGAVALSLYVEALPFTAVSCAAGAAWLIAPAQGLPLILGTLVCIALVLFVLAGWAWPAWAPTPADPMNYSDTLRAGIPLMLGGLLAMLASTSGRLGIGLFGDAEMTGTFAALSRIAALPIVAHQLAVVARFKNIYSIGLPQLEQLVTQVGRFVALSVGITLVVLPLASPFLGPAFHTAATEHPLAAGLLVAQVILWSGISLNDLIAARHEILSRVLPWSGSALAVAVSVAAWSLTSHDMTVDRFAVWHTAVMFVLFAAQTVALGGLGVRFDRFWALCMLAFLGATVIAWLAA